jgi:hypothetical protein
VNRAAAKAAALAWAGELLDSSRGERVDVLEETGKFYAGRAKELISRVFEYNEKPAPPAGTIVEVWDGQEADRSVAYSCGHVCPDGWLYATPDYEDHTDLVGVASWKNWRVVGGPDETKGQDGE